MATILKWRIWGDDKPIQISGLDSQARFTLPVLCTVPQVVFTRFERYSPIWLRSALIIDSCGFQWSLVKNQLTAEVCM